MRQSRAAVVALLGVLASAQLVAAEPPLPDALELPAVQSFLGADGFGRMASGAPPETEEFGRLAGVWMTEQEYVGADGEWIEGPPGLWIWQYGLDGYAVTDLWLQPESHLPAYLGDLGRDYLLSSVRVFDVRSEQWQQAWMANGAGATPGQDFGTLNGARQDDRIVMTAPPGEFGIQRVVFSDITADSFRWTSQYSQDEGETWLTAMRIVARRVEDS